MKFFLILFMFWGIEITTLAAEKKPEAEISDKIPARIHISYTVQTSIGHGELNEIVDISQKSDTHTFDINSNAQATGIFKVIKPGNIVRKSHGTITEKGLQPTYYSDQRVNNKSSLALFDWKNQTLTLRHEDKETVEPLVSCTLDRLSLSYNFIFSSPTSLQPGTLLEIHVTDGRGLQLMQFKVSEEKLNTPLGELETIVLTKLHTKQDKMQRKIWLAPRYHLIPVRIQSVETDGLEVEKMIASVDLDYTDNNSCCKH